MQYTKTDAMFSPTQLFGDGNEWTYFLCPFMNPGGPVTAEENQFKTGLCHCCGTDNTGCPCDTPCVCCLACMQVTAPVAIYQLDNAVGEMLDVIEKKPGEDETHKNSCRVCLAFMFADISSCTLANVTVLGAYENKIRRAGKLKKPEGACCCQDSRECQFCCCSTCAIVQLTREARLVKEDYERKNNKGGVQRSQPPFKNSML